MEGLEMEFDDIGKDKGGSSGSNYSKGVDNTP